MEADALAVILARVQFAVTIGFHFIFPPVTIGMAWIIFILMSRYKKHKNEYYKNLVRFWIKLFAVSFAIGVASGIVMEFQFGTNWEKYSRFVGDIFGSPLAAEGVFAFFLESSFLAILLFGWNRVSVKLHWFSSLMVAVGSTLSAFWILVANAWQQTPTGYELVYNEAGEVVGAKLVDFFAAVFNPSTLSILTHTLDACLMTGAFFMLGVSAWFLLKSPNLKFAKENIKLTLIIAFIFSVLQLPLGHYSANKVAETQPAKLAAMEGIFESSDEDYPLLVFGIPDEDEQKIHFAIKIPKLLSWLLSEEGTEKLNTLDQIPKESRPPLFLTFTSFHLMVGIGMLLIFITSLGVFLLWRRRLFDKKLLMRIFILCIPLPFIANELGWVATEVGRQPWVVYNLLKTRDAISVTVPASEILFSLILFSVIYTLLFGLWIFILRREIKHGLTLAQEIEDKMEVAK